MTADEFRKKTDDELKTELKNLTEGLFKLRFRKVTDVIEDPNQIRSMKKDIARIHTLLREKALKKQKEEAGAKQAAEKAPAKAPAKA